LKKINIPAIDGKSFLMVAGPLALQAIFKKPPRPCWFEKGRLHTAPVLDWFTRPVKHTKNYGTSPCFNINYKWYRLII